jgi:hypothetical protein
MLVPVLPSLGMMAGTASAAPVQKCREKRQNSILLSVGFWFLEAMSACEA